MTFVLASLVFAAYAPALNNGFISDDYVVLQRAEALKHDPFVLFSTPPEAFRLTSFLSFLILKTLFGYHALFFYAFTILLHLVNVLLFRKLLFIICKSEEVAVMGAMIFATIQNPQEGVFWLAGMNEVLLGAFVLAALLLWLQGRFAVSGLSYLAAFLSKESALILVALMPLMELGHTGRLRLKKEHAYILIPTLSFVLLFLYFAPTNFHLASQMYAFKLHAVPVTINSLHRLLLPWGYVMLALVACRRGLSELRVAGLPLAWTGLALLPYVFLTYQNHVPSRNQYLASMGMAWLLSSLAGKIPEVRWKYAMVAVFAISNIAYIWLKKDAQYVRRAAPTEQLVQELRRRTPARLRIMNFQENPWIAKETTQVVPGWRSDLLSVNESPDACPHCPLLVWDGRGQRYVAGPERP